MKSRYKQQSGFSVLELATVTVIVMILTILAFPAYREYVKKSKIAEARQTLGTMVTLQKTFYIQNHQFYSLKNNGLGSEYPGQDPTKFAKLEDWDLVGYPIEVGTQTYFNYSVGAGKFDDTGTDVSTFVTPINGLIPATGSFNLGASLTYNDGPKECALTVGGSIYPVTPAYFGVNSNPGGAYDWAILVARGNLEPGTESPCNFIMYILEATPASSNVVVAGKSFIEFQSATDFAGLNGEFVSTTATDGGDGGIVTPHDACVQGCDGDQNCIDGCPSVTPHDACVQACGPGNGRCTAGCPPLTGYEQCLQDCGWSNGRCTANCPN